MKEFIINVGDNKGFAFFGLFWKKTTFINAITEGFRGSLI